MITLPNEIQTERRPNCPLCNSLGKPLYEDLPSALFDTPGRWSFSQCPHHGCGLIWINPTPIAADLHRAYATYFTHGDGGNSRSKRLRLRGLLYGIYRTVNYPGWVLCGIQREKSRWAQMFLDELTPGKMLDVGCGDGKFLSQMKARGWAVDGIDFDAAAIKTAKEKYGLSLRHGDLRAVRLPAQSYEAITMSHVIEHVIDPVGLLAETKQLLKVGGRLVVTTPNIESLGHQRFGSHWFGIDAPRHLNLFSAQALSESARRAGFADVHVGSTSANADVFFGASFTLQEKQGHRMGHEPTPNLKRTLKAAWWQYREHLMLRRHPKCGEELVLICRAQ